MTPLRTDGAAERPASRSPLLAIFLIVAVDVLGYTIILPLLPFYSEHLGARPEAVGTLIATYAFFQLLAGPILGQLSDRHGRRPILLISQIGTFVGFIVLGLARQLWVVFLARGIDGATAGNLSVAQAYICGCDQAGESRQIVRAHRHCLRSRLHDRPCNLGRPHSLGLWSADFRRGRSVVH